MNTYLQNKLQEAKMALKWAKLYAKNKVAKERNHVDEVKSAIKWEGLYGHKK